MSKFERCVIATRESPLAMWQALHIQSVLRQRYPQADVELLGMTSRGDQILNAASYEKRGLARVLPQEQMTTDTLYQAILELVRDGDSLRAALRDAPPADGTMAVLGLIHEIQK